MAKISITQAAKLAGVSRSNLYKTYIDKGLITVSKDNHYKPCIDTSELLRVFPVLQSDTPKEDKGGHHSTPLESEENTPDSQIMALQSEVTQLKQQLSKSEAREAWYQAQIQSLTDTMKWLEGPKTQRRWWPFWK